MGGPPVFIEETEKLCKRINIALGVSLVPLALTMIFAFLSDNDKTWFYFGYAFIFLTVHNCVEM